MEMTPVHLRVRELREAKGISQAALSRESGVRRATINAIEAGKTTGVDFDVLEKLAKTLGVDPGFLVVRTAGKGKKR